MRSPEKLSDKSFTSTCPSAWATGVLVAISEPSYTPAADLRPGRVKYDKYSPHTAKTEQGNGEVMVTNRK